MKRKEIMGDRENESTRNNNSPIYENKSMQNMA